MPNNSMEPTAAPLSDLSAALIFMRWVYRAVAHLGSLDRVAMPPLNFIVLVLFVIISVLLYIFDLQKSAVITFLFGLLTFVLDKIPRSGISIKLERVNKNTHKVIVQNLGSLKISKIQYVFHGRMKIEDLPTRLEPHQIVEFPVGLSFETGTRLDIGVSYLPQFGLSRKKQHITTEAIG